MGLLNALTAPPRAATAIAVGYLGVLTAAAWRTRDRARIEAQHHPDRRLAVLIPAHDEAVGIGATLDSLRAVDYPSDLVEVHVVADHCHDDTADVVRAHGFRVHERNHDRPGKGPALTWLLDRVMDEGAFDAVVFVDADTVVAPDALSHLMTVMADGHAVVQGHYAVRDPDQTGIVAFRAAALAARTYLRPMGRTAIGGSAGLYGTGMAFRADVAREMTWSGHLTEDVETQLQLLDEGVLVAFAPAARFAAEMPTTLAAAESQHERWERGRAQLAVNSIPRLLGQVVRGGPVSRRASLDAALDQAVPPFSIVVLASGIWAGAAMTRLLITPRRAAAWCDAGVAALTMTTQVSYVWCALRLVDAPPAVVRSLWTEGPKMLWWKVRLWTRVLRTRGDGEWVRTARNAAVPS